MRSNSAFSRGAPASPSSQQPPLHFSRSQTNCSSTTLSLTRILSIAINALILSYKYTCFRSLFIFPPEGIDQVRQVFLQEIVDDAKGVFVRGGVKIKGATE